MSRSLLLRRSLLGLTLAVACTDHNPVDPGATPVAHVAVQPAQITLVEGGTALLAAAGLDASNQPVNRFTVATWGSSNAAVATVSSVGRVVGVAPGAAAVSAKIDGITGQALVTVIPRPVGAVVVEPSVLSLQSGDTVRVVATVKDSTGAILTQRHVQWTITPGVATVDTGGLVRAYAAGSATLTAQADSKVGTASVTVAWAPLDTIVVTGMPTSSPEAGVTFQLKATAYDAHRDVLPTAIAWESTTPAVATVSASGRVQALAEGTTTIRASAGTKVTALTLTVKPGTVPSILSIAPSPMLAGQTATLSGINFDPTASKDTVLVNGQFATVTQASATSLSIRVPVPSARCQPTQLVPVEVHVATDAGPKVATSTATLASTHQLALAPGDAYVQLTPSAALDSTCVELPAPGGTYVISLFNASTAPSAQIALSLYGKAGASSAAQVMASRAPSAWSFASAPASPGAPGGMPRFSSPAVSRVAPAVPAALRAAARQHAALLAQNAAIARRMSGRSRRTDGLPRPILESLRATTSGSTTSTTAPLRASGPARAPQVGDKITVRVGSFSNLCTTAVQMQARVVYSGTYAVVLEDPSNPLAGQMDAQLQQMGQEFDNRDFPLLKQYFGDPFAYDGQLSGIGKVYMLFTKQVNADGDNLNGYVTTADFMSTASCAASNVTEIFYARVPTRTADLGTWAASLRSTVTHEVKHLTSYAEHFIRNANTEDGWLEEAMAMTAEELWARQIYTAYHYQGDQTFAQGLQCETQIITGTASGTCATQARVMYDHVAFLYDHLQHPDSLTPIGNPQVDYTIYGSGWSMVRWALDHTGLSEATALQRITQNATATGVANLTSVTGFSFNQLLAGRALALATDNTPNVTIAPQYQYLGWNLPDIYGNLHSAFGRSFPTAQPIPFQPLSFGTLAATAPSLRGGGVTYFRLDGTPTGPQLVQLRGAGGSATIPSTAGFAIIRIQ